MAVVRVYNFKSFIYAKMICETRLIADMTNEGKYATNKFQKRLVSVAAVLVSAFARS